MMEDPDFLRTMPDALAALVREVLALKTPRPDTAALCLRLIDHTSLKASAPMVGGEAASDIAALCAEARAYGAATVCVYPNHIPAARDALAGSGVRLAVVNNFPHGEADGASAAADAAASLAAGAVEIDTVLDRRLVAAGRVDEARERLARVHEATRAGKGRLKTILQANTYDTYDALYAAAQLAISAGCDFVKTCTGKPPPAGFGEAPDISSPWIAATVMQAVADSGRATLGVKISGGVATAVDCERLRLLQERIIGAEKFTPDVFRIGASALAANLRGESLTDSY